MAANFRTTRRVEFGDTDMAGIMHFAKFFNFMEEAETEFLRSLGLSVVKQYQGKRIGFPRVAAKCDFVKPIFFEDVVEIQVTLARLGNKSVTYAFEFFTNGEMVAKGETSACCCQMTPGEPPVGMAIPAEIRRVLTQESGVRG